MASGVERSTLTPQAQQRRQEKLSLSKVEDGRSLLLVSNADHPHLSQIPVADRRRDPASDRHFQPSTDRIQNHLFSGAGQPSPRTADPPPAGPQASNGVKPRRRSAPHPKPKFKLPQYPADRRIDRPPHAPLCARMRVRRLDSHRMADGVGIHRPCGRAIAGACAKPLLHHRPTTSACTTWRPAHPAHASWCSSPAGPCRPGSGRRSSPHSRTAITSWRSIRAARANPTRPPPATTRTAARATSPSC